jgi:hypothetical protein
MWSQSSQQEKLATKSRNPKRLEKTRKCWQMLSQKNRQWMCFDSKNKIRLKETLINTTEKQTKLLANDMYINQMKINKLNKNF